MVFLSIEESKMNMGEAQRGLDGPTYPCDCGDVYHFPENLAVHKTACQMSKVKADLKFQTEEAQRAWDERKHYRDECMELRVKLQQAELQISELERQNKDWGRMYAESQASWERRLDSANRLNEESKKKLADIEHIATLFWNGKPEGPLGMILDILLGKTEKRKDECRHEWEQVGTGFSMGGRGTVHFALFMCKHCKAKKTPEVTDMCHCGHARGDHAWDLGCSICACKAKRECPHGVEVGDRPCGLCS